MPPAASSFSSFSAFEGVPGGAVDVFAHHGGECRGRPAAFGEQAGHAPAAGDADAVDDDRLLLVRKTYGDRWDIPGRLRRCRRIPLPRPANEGCTKNSASTGQPQRLLVVKWAPKHPAKMTPP
jgi:hypothetical protein